MSLRLLARGPLAAAIAPTTLLLALAAASASPAFGQISPEDQKVFAEYRLTLPTFSKVAQATENYVTALKSDPSLLKQFRSKRSDQSEEPDGAEALSIAGFAAAFERQPVIRRAIVIAGLSPREYATFSLAAGFAGMAKYTLEQDATTKLSAVERDNVEFLRKHEAEVTRLNQLTMWLNQDNEEQSPR